MEIKEQLKQIVADVSGIKLSDLQDDTTIKQLELDSLDIVQIAFYIEEKMNFAIIKSISMDDLKLHTVGSFLDMLVARIKKNG